jgi:FlaA1/EpsC-like NDP-sugar epimerase
VSRVVVIAAGGHGREIADVARACAAAGQPVELVGFVDDNPELARATVHDVPVLGRVDWLLGRADIEVVCGIGSPAVRKRVVQRLSARDSRLHQKPSITPPQTPGVSAPQIVL